MIEIESQMELMMDINQNILLALGVGHPQITKITGITTKYRLYSKITGAGGGGCVYTLAKSNVDNKIINEVIDELSRNGFDNFVAKLGVDGVKLHNNMDDIPNLMK